MNRSSLSASSTAAALFATLCLGCGETGSPPATPAPMSAPQAASGGGPPPVTAPPAPVPPPSKVPAPVAAPATTADAQAAPGAPPAAIPPPGTTMQKASSELTKSGQAGAKVGKGILATPASVYLSVRDRPIFMNMQHAMDLYKATNGNLPATHDEFMREIITANNINLPELPPDSKYIYMPDKGELMIERTQ